MRAYVEKLEGPLARVSVGEGTPTVLSVPLADLPAGVREGEVLRLDFKRDRAATVLEQAKRSENGPS
ncbi:MAG TPA: hypothetical protein V6D47_03305 [Oscillatoriaceae cyanobacterium]